LYCALKIVEDEHVQLITREDGLAVLSKKLLADIRPELPDDVVEAGSFQLCCQFTAVLRKPAPLVGNKSSQPASMPFPQSRVVKAAASRIGLGNDDTDNAYQLGGKNLHARV